MANSGSFSNYLNDIESCHQRFVKMQKHRRKSDRRQLSVSFDKIKGIIKKQNSTNTSVNFQKLKNSMENTRITQKEFAPSSKNIESLYRDEKGGFGREEQSKANALNFGKFKQQLSVSFDKIKGMMRNIRDVEKSDLTGHIFGSVRALNVLDSIFKKFTETTKKTTETIKKQNSTNASVNFQKLKNTIENIRITQKNFAPSSKNIESLYRDEKRLIRIIEKTGGTPALSRELDRIDVLKDRLIGGFGREEQSKANALNFGEFKQQLKEIKKICDSVSFDKIKGIIRNIRDVEKSDLTGREKKAINSANFEKLKDTINEAKERFKMREKENLENENKKPQNIFVRAISKFAGLITGFAKGVWSFKYHILAFGAYVYSLFNGYRSSIFTGSLAGMGGEQIIHAKNSSKHITGGDHYLTTAQSIQNALRSFKQNGAFAMLGYTGKDHDRLGATNGLTAMNEVYNRIGAWFEKRLGKEWLTKTTQGRTAQAIYSTTFQGITGQDFNTFLALFKNKGAFFQNYNAKAKLNKEEFKSAVRVDDSFNRLLSNFSTAIKKLLTNLHIEKLVEKIEANVNKLPSLLAEWGKKIYEAIKNFLEIFGVEFSHEKTKKIYNRTTAGIDSSGDALRALKSEFEKKFGGETYLNNIAQNIKKAKEAGVVPAFEKQNLDFIKNLQKEEFFKLSPDIAKILNAEKKGEIKVVNNVKVITKNGRIENVIVETNGGEAVRGLVEQGRMR